MSQMRVMVRELRAVFTAATVCALILGLVFSNFAQAAGMRMTPSSGGKQGAYALCVQHLTHQQASVDDAAAPTKGDEAGHHKCPGCCLAANLASAVLPERDVSTFTPFTATPMRVAYFAASPRAPGPTLLRAAHGARAPPV